MVTTGNPSVVVRGRISANLSISCLQIYYPMPKRPYLNVTLLLNFYLIRICIYIFFPTKTPTFG